MFIPQHFSVSDENEKLEFIRMHSFGQLTSHVDGQIFASHLPLLLSDDGKSYWGTWPGLIRSGRNWKISRFWLYFKDPTPMSVLPGTASPACPHGTIRQCMFMDMSNAFMTANA